MTPRDQTDADHTRYAEWDGAYVLGALSPAERREFETHLEGCERCRASVAELSGLPGLLARIDDERAFALLEDVDSVDDEATGMPLPTPPADLVARIQQSEKRRRTRRVRLITGLAAAAVVAGAVAIPVATLSTAPQPTVAVALGQSEQSPLSAQVQLTSATWGTRIDMHCGYGSASSTWGDQSVDGRGSFGLWVVDRQGKASQVSTWAATSGSNVRLSAATALQLHDIAKVEVRSVATDDVLLSKSLR